jgi:hypothetical protein
MDVVAREMMRVATDGQVVWSWFPDAGIKSVELDFGLTAETPRSTGDGG